MTTPAPPPPPPPAGEPLGGGPRPVGKAERIVALDVLRGFALLGILLVNIELFRGSRFYDHALGDVPVPTGADRVTEFVTGWLAAGKFVSSFALLFGLGAAMIAGRVAARGRPPRPVLVRRYGWLLLFGLAHMALLFPGDILFHYGLAGLALLLFLDVRPRTAVRWAVGLIVLAALGFTLVVALSAIAEPAAMADDPFTQSYERFLERRQDAAIEAYTTGGPIDRVAVRAFESLLVQSGQLFYLPWTLGMFLFGFAIWRSGVLLDDHRRRHVLRRTATVALPVGLLLNLPLGWVGPLGGAMVGGDTGAGGAVVLLATAAQTLGAPVLAVGYLAAIGLACERAAVAARLGWLRDAGRMALSGYLLQSLLAAIVFGWFRLYDELSATQALVVVAGIWMVVLAISHLTMRRFERGPVEHLWRLGTYGRSPS